MNKLENLKIVGNEYRTRILSLLYKTPCTVSEITEVLNISTANASKYLAQLSDAKMISHVKRGSYNYYYLTFEFSYRYDDVLNIIIAIQDEPQITKDKELLSTLVSNVRSGIRSKLMFNKQDLKDLLIKQVHFNNLESYEGIIDIRESAEYDHNHLPGTINVPMSIILTQPENYLEFDQEYKMICQTQTRTHFVARELVEMGYDICMVQGGMDYYTKYVLPNA